MGLFEEVFDIRGILVYYSYGGYEMSRRRIDITGETFGRLTVIRYLESRGHNTYWLCYCTCGVVVGVRKSHLRDGRTKSCGCLRKEIVVELAKNRHAYKHGCLPRGLYNTWSSAKDRCCNSNTPAYKHYGNRGIEMCSEWREDFKVFRSWALANGYRDGLTIDRINNDRGYYPDNCQWLTRSENSKKRNREVPHERPCGQESGDLTPHTL